MELNIIIDYLIISIMASLAINSVLRNFAKEKKLLVDIPDRSRKFHKRATPLTGGIGILLAVIVSTEIYLDMNNLKGYMPEFSEKLYIASIPLLVLFLIDDFTKTFVFLDPGIEPFKYNKSFSISALMISIFCMVRNLSPI